ncbi:MAG TPA: hypothetical protein VFT69_01340 [Pseudolabrys sp.]|nr:hypothetical protein [Pseudolabrys sp.]
MIGASLSRWTLSYFAAALLAFIGAQALMAAGFGFPNAPIASPETLVLVHVVALGWLSLLMCGALFQFVPVLVARPLYSNTLPLPALACLLSGIGALLCGFLQLDGRIAADLPLLPAAAALLGVGFTLVVWNLGRTLWSARPLTLPARYVAVGLLSLVATVALGIIFALVLGGVSAPAFAELTARGLPIHVIAGLGGWLTFTAMGVSYRLLAMFMLAPELDGLSTRITLYAGATGLVLAIVGGIAAISLYGNADLALAAAGAVGLLALGLYGSDVLHLYRARKRRKIELNSRMAAFALTSLAVAVVLTIICIALGALSRHIGAIAFLLAFGWLSGLGLAKLYKIVPFLTWLECYGPILGKRPTPRVQDLVVEQRALKWFLLYFVVVWLGTLMLLLGYELAFRAAAALMLVATGGIVFQLVRSRRLADVKADMRLPDGAHYPKLLLSLTPHR